MSKPPHVAQRLLGLTARTGMAVLLCGALAVPAAAQSVNSFEADKLEFTGTILPNTCQASASIKLFSNPYVVSLPVLKSTDLLQSGVSPATALQLDFSSTTSPTACAVNYQGTPHLVFDIDLASIAPRSGLLRNSATLRPAQNVFVQLGIIDEAGLFSPLDMKRPVALNQALGKEGSTKVTLGVRYVASNAFLAQFANPANAEAGLQDVSAGNVSIFLPFLLKID